MRRWVLRRALRERLALALLRQAQERPHPGEDESEVTVGILWFLVFGLFVGFLARALMPGRQNMGLLMTSALGMVGSLLGGFLGSLISSEEVTRVHAAGLIGSVLGALLVLGLVGMGGRRRMV